jgi:acyl-CoA reductase-like NAD-dependent aldehyde dehydrogenase
MPAPGHDDTASSTRSTDSILQAQRNWADQTVPERLRIIARLRQLLVREAKALSAASGRIRGVDAAQVITSEVLPLIEGCRFLENHATEILAPRRLGLLDRPLWLGGVHSEIRREPYGRVLILAPSNYPLFLAGAQLLQALVAGNAVLVKPAPGAAEPIAMLRDLLRQAALPDGLCTLLPEDPEAVHEWIRKEVDKVILTGGTAAGRAVLQTCAESIVPATVELSGVDVVHVLEDANPARAADLVLYGLALNHGRTCIAPRRLLVQRGVAGRLRTALQDRFRSRRAPVTDLLPWVRQEVNEALAGGARVIAGTWAEAEGIYRYPLVLEHLPATSRLRTEDHFAPICSFQEVTDEEEAIALDRECPYALGATVFTRNEQRGAAFGSRLPAGSVTVNDLIVPTADPRIPFGGRKRSGFGVTRGAEGLWELTTPQVISRRSENSWLPHLDAPAPGDEERFAHLLNLLHGSGLISRLTSLGYLLKRGRRNDRSNQTSNHG